MSNQTESVAADQKNEVKVKPSLNLALKRLTSEYSRELERKFNVYQRIIATAVLVGFLFVSMVGFATALWKTMRTGEPISTFAWLLIIAPATAALGRWMFRFLEGPGHYDNPADFGSLSELLNNDIQSTASERNVAKVLSEEDRTSIAIHLREELRKQTTEGFIDEIRETVAAQENVAVWDSYFNLASRRFDAEIAAQGRRGTLNLILGVFTALSGIMLLSYVVLTTNHPSTGINDFLISFIPRVSIIAIIEVFAYFFLRLYKSGLGEIKYFQNEATNLEARAAALRVSLESKDAQLIGRVVDSLLSVERNPLLDKEKTTLELEREKLDLNAVSISLPQAFALARDLLLKERDEQKSK